MTCPHANISLPTTSDPDTVCADCGKLKQGAMTMTKRTAFWESVWSLRHLETTIIAAGEDGITIADLQAATGLSRRTIDRNLNALQSLGSGIYNDGSGGRVARRWMLSADHAVFRWMVRIGVR